MKKNEKFLNKIPLQDKEKILTAIDYIIANDFKYLDIKKLSGKENVYRVRVGNFRIKFTMNGEYNEITEISRRNDNTYKF